MLPADLVQTIDLDHRATEMLLEGDPRFKKDMFSRRDDVCLANPLDPPVLGHD
jgi:ketosteroid isomerase-like protein